MKFLKLNQFKHLWLFAIIAATVFTNAVIAQDLIKDTRNGTRSVAKKEVEPNNIAKKVQETLKYTKFMNANAFTLSDNQQQLVAKNKADIDDAVYLNYNEDEIAKIVETSPMALKLRIPVTATNGIELELIKNDFTASGFKITTSEGDEFDMSERALFYKGYVKGYPNSLAAITIFDGEISGIISDEVHNYDIGAIKSNAKQVIFYNSKNLKDDFNFVCQTKDLPNNLDVNQTNTKKSSKNSLANDECRNDCVGVYYEVTQDFYLYKGSKAAVVEYITRAFNNAVLVFLTHDIKICLSHIHIWTGNDPYTDIMNAGAMSNQFSTNIANYNYPGTIGFLIYHHPPTPDPNDTDTDGGSGTAWWADVTIQNPDNSYTTIPCLCSDHTSRADNYGPNGAIGFNESLLDYPTSSRDGLILVHETGHSFGSTHTQVCVWNGNNTAIDGCVASEPWNGNTCLTPTSPLYPSIMSYCWYDNEVPFTAGFGPGPGDLMKANYEIAIAGCLGTGDLDIGNNDDVFGAYPWLSNEVDQTNCTNDRITVFKDGNNSLIYVETDASSKLYWQTGSLICTETANFDCIAAYSLYEIEMLWLCCNEDATDCDNDPLTPSFDLPSFTSENTPITLTGIPAGGAFSGSGVVFSAFNPSLSGPGSHEITYSITENDCTSSVTQSILVFTIEFNFVNYNLGTISPRLDGSTYALDCGVSGGEIVVEMTINEPYSAIVKLMQESTGQETVLIPSFLLSNGYPKKQYKATNLQADKYVLSIEHNGVVTEESFEIVDVADSKVTLETSEFNSLAFSSPAEDTDICTNDVCEGRGEIGEIGEIYLGDFYNLAANLNDNYSLGISLKQGNTTISTITFTNEGTSLDLFSNLEEGSYNLKVSLIQKIGFLTRILNTVTKNIAINNSCQSLHNLGGNKSGVADELEILSNPVVDFLNVKSSLKGKFRIYNAQGIEMGQFDLAELENEKRIDLSDWPAGSYFIQHRSSNTLKKIIKL